MALLSTLRAWVSGSRRRGRAQQAGRRPGLRVEPLERRELLNATISPPNSPPGSRPVIKQSPNLYAIREMYGDLLLRAPSLQELATWDNLLKNGVNRAQMAQVFVTSTEFRANLVKQEYRAILGRAAEPAGLNLWTNALGAGLSIEQLSSMLLGSQEFIQRSSPSRNLGEWLEGVYSDVLGRGIDAAGKAAWLDVLNRGADTSAVALAIIRSPEHLTRMIGNTYEQLLRRQADSFGTNFWLAALRNGLSYTQFIGAVASSQEYGNISRNTTGTNGEGQVGVIGGNANGQFHGGEGDIPIDGGGGQGGGGQGGGEGGILPRGGIRGGGPPGGGGPRGGGGGSGGSPGGSGGIARGADVNVSNSAPLDYAEISIAVNPTNPNNIVIGTNTLNDLPLDTFFTFDGGVTWSRFRFDATVDRFAGIFVQRSDPSVVFDANGRLYVAYLLSSTPGDAPADRTNLVVARSTTGGRSYEVSFAVDESAQGGAVNNDKELLAVGPAPGNPAQQNVYLAWTRFAPGNNRIVVAGSVDGGVTWSPPTAVSDNVLGQQQFAAPAVGINGEVYVSFWKNGEILFDVSPTFDGTTFAFGADRKIVALSSVNIFVTIPAQPLRQIIHAPTIVVDRTNRPTRGRIHLVYNDRPIASVSPDFNIYTMVSTDGGLTWSFPRQINDDLGPNSQFHPNLAMDQRNGCVSYMWRDARDDAANRRVHIYSAVSSDGGASNAANFQVSDNPSDESASTNPNNFLEYDGIDAFNGRTYYAWADNSANPNGNKQIFFDVVDSGCAGSSLPPGGGGGGGQQTPGLPPDAFELNETSDQATNLGSLRGARSLTGLTIGRKSNGLPDYDWYQGSASASGRLTVRMNYNSPERGDLHLRVFVRNSAGTLSEIGSSRAIGATSQTVVADVGAGSMVLVWVFGFNSVQGNYDLSIDLV